MIASALHAEIFVELSGPFGLCRCVFCGSRHRLGHAALELGWESEYVGAIIIA